MSTPISQFKQSPASAVGNSLTDIYQAPSGKTSYCIQLDISCTGVTGVQVDIAYIEGVNTFYLGKSLPVPVGSALQVIDSQKMVINSEGKIQVKCVTAGEVVDVLCSVIEDVNA